MTNSHGTRRPLSRGVLLGRVRLTLPRRLFWGPWRLLPEVGPPTAEQREVPGPPPGRSSCSRSARAASAKGTRGERGQSREAPHTAPARGHREGGVGGEGTVCTVVSRRKAQEEPGPGFRLSWADGSWLMGDEEQCAFFSPKEGHRSRGTGQGAQVKAWSSQQWPPPPGEHRAGQGRLHPRGGLACWQSQGHREVSPVWRPGRPESRGSPLWLGQPRAEGRTPGCRGGILQDSLPTR